MQSQNATYISSALFKKNLPKTVAGSLNQILHLNNERWVSNYVTPLIIDSI